MGVRSPYRSTMMPGTAKNLGINLVNWGADLMFAHHGRAASNPDFLLALHRNGVKTAAYLCDEPYESGETAKYSPRFKFVFSMDPCTVEAHRASREGRRNVFYLPPGVDVEHFEYRNYDERKIPAFFLGNGDLIPRRKWLEPIDRLIDGADIRYFPHREKGPVGKGHKKWISVEQHPKFYANCLVGLNVHRSPVITKECFKRRVVGRGRAEGVPKGIKLCPQMPRHEGTGFWNEGNLPAAHVNPRFLEMAACGTLVVSDDSRSELARMFPMAPRAQDPEHFYELVRHYIDHPLEAEAIGQACSSLISRRHSYRHRAAEVLIRSGLKESDEASLHSSLGEPADWLTPQDCSLLGIESFLDRTGPSERWSPQLGMSLTRTSGKVSEATSLDVPTPWL